MNIIKEIRSRIDCIRMYFDPESSEGILLCEIIDLSERLNEEVNNLKIKCKGAGQCDYDGTGCTPDNNCGEYEI